jgi:hypothetical protein
VLVVVLCLAAAAAAWALGMMALPKIRAHRAARYRDTQVSFTYIVGFFT